MPLPLYQRKILIGALLFCLLIITFCIRIQGTGHLSNLQFTGNDAYLYHWQAGIISEHGRLPARDMHRWLPLGRDNGQLLSLYAYAIAYIHKVVPWLSLYHIQLYLPTLCFTLALGVLFLLFVRTNGVIFATIVALLLATLPGSVERSTAGFGDRDAWCWMFGVLSVASYLWKEHKQPGKRRYIATAMSGVTVFLGGLSWEAFGIFVLIIHVVELYKFCTTDTEEHLKEHLLYMLMFVPGLYLIQPRLSQWIRFLHPCCRSHVISSARNPCAARHQVYATSVLCTAASTCQENRMGTNTLRHRSRGWLSLLPEPYL